MAKAFPGSAKSKGTRGSIKIPATFSIIRKPKAALEIIRRLVVFGRRPSTTDLLFDHSRLVAFDLAAEQVLDVMVREIKEERRGQENQLHINGVFPRSPHAARFIRAVGIIKNLHIEHAYLTADEQSNLEVFDLFRGRRPKSEVAAGNYKAETTERFADHINKCLRRNRRQLTKNALLQLCEYIGEILANAEEHSGSTGSDAVDGHEWFLAGYLDNAVSPHMCEIAIFDFGRSIADSFADLPAESYPRKQVEPYLSEHKSYFRSGYRAEDLLTLVALQGGISSKNADEGDTRGHGTIDLIRFFERMHSECTGGTGAPPEMAILSGSTHILFDGKYKISVDKNGRNIIAFNESNSLADKPDFNYVRNLISVKFPGTVISIRFALEGTELSAPSTGSATG